MDKKTTSVSRLRSTLALHKPVRVNFLLLGTLHVLVMTNKLIISPHGHDTFRPIPMPFSAKVSSAGNIDRSDDRPRV
jgi:hypothetical protein